MFIPTKETSASMSDDVVGADARVFQVFDVDSSLELGAGLNEASCIGVFCAATVVAVLLIWLVCTMNEDSPLSRSSSAVLLSPQPQPHEKLRSRSRFDQ